MKGICFKEDMFNAIIDGKKTQTRRVIKPQLIKDLHQETETGLYYWRNRLHDIQSILANSRYKVGEIVYLKEPYNNTYFVDGEIVYKYDNDFFVNQLRIKWKNKLFMPVKYARYFIKITDIEVKRLQNISAMNIIEEGIERSKLTDACLRVKDEINRFKILWNSIHKNEYTWDDNPFVFVYNFELINKEKIKENGKEVKQ